MVLLLTIPLPWAIKRPILSSTLGYELDTTSHIGFAIVDAAKVRMGRGARVGHLTVVQNLDSFELGPFAYVGTRCSVSGAPNTDPDFGHLRRDPRLRMGMCSILTSRHYIDCSDSVEIGDYSMLAGGNTQVLTHEISVDEGRQRTEPVVIGSHALIHSRCVIVAGARVPDKVVVAAGAVVHGELEDSHALYGGLPARKLRDIDPEAGFFKLDFVPE
jgi:acetyltransferase-like isoleucine patch superfamily enzyme